METSPALKFVLIFMMICSVSLAGSYSGGDGTVPNPYKIDNAGDWVELTYTSGDWSDNFILINDIDLSEVENLIPVAADTLPDTEIFTGTPFNGFLNGNGHTIYNAVINLPTNHYVGLFGYLSEGAYIKNLNLSNCNVSGAKYVGSLAGYCFKSKVSLCNCICSVNGDEYVGGLIGYYLESVITHCHMDCDVSGDSYIGGMLGYSEARVNSCSSMGSVIATGRYIGGLIGRSYRDSDIANCHSSCYVEGNKSVGGLTGYSYYIDIMDSYATGEIYANSNLGGLIGENWSTEIENCYSSGPVNGNEYAGGLIGLDYNGDLINCYSSSDVTADDYVGGLTGSMTYNYTYNCYCNGDVHGSSKIGGITGSYQSCILMNCYSVSPVTGGDEYAGALIGFISGNIYIYDCFWNSVSSEVNTGVGSNDPDPGGVRESTVSLMQNIETYLNSDWDFAGTSINGTDDVWIMNGYPEFADLKADIVDMKDFAVLAANWLSEECEYEDPCWEANWDNNGIIDGFDLMMMMDYWLYKKPPQGE